MAKKAFVYDGSQWVDIAQSTADLTNILPAGIISPYAGSAAPNGYMLCNGSAINRTDYARLFTAIGTAYGAGNGSTTFNIPDLRGRVIAGVDNMGGTDASRLDLANSLGTTTGSQYVTLTAAQSGLPAHSHGITDPSHAHGATARTESAPGSSGWSGVSSAVRAAYNSYTLDNQYVPVYGATTGITINNNTAANASSAHDNMQPTIIMNYIIKL